MWREAGGIYVSRFSFVVRGGSGGYGVGRFYLDVFSF